MSMRIVFCLAALWCPLVFVYAAVPLEIKPMLVLDVSAIGAQRKVALTVLDRRGSSDSLGSVRMADGASSELIAANDAVDAVRKAFSSGLEQLSFSVDERSPVSLIVSLDQLQYRAEPSAVTDSRGSALIVVRAQREGGSFEREYSFSTRYRYPQAPDPAAIEQLLNSVLAGTLRRPLMDSSLTDFLRH